MRTRIICSIATAALVLGACGGGGGGSRGEDVDQLMTSAKDTGLDLDKSCVEDIASKLSDDDAKRIVDAGPDGTPVLSDEGEALGEEILGCVSMDSLIDSIVADVGDENVDVECLKDALKGLSPAELAAGDLPDGMLDCIKPGG